MLSFTELAVTLAEADAYATSRGIFDWYQDEAALRRGQDYIAAVYNTSWSVAFENDAAPDPVKYAIIEAAVLELATPGFFSRTYTPAERKVLTQVEGIKWTLTGGKGSSSSMPVSTKIEGLLSGYVAGPLPAVAVV